MIHGGHGYGTNNSNDDDNSIYNVSVDDHHSIDNHWWQQKIMLWL